MALPGLTDELIAQLLSKGGKNKYAAPLNEFVESGEKAICVNETWAQFKDAKATTLSQGFKSAIEKGGENGPASKVAVRTNDEKVYLLNLGAIQAAQDEA